MKTIQSLGQTLIVEALLLGGTQGRSQVSVSRTTIVVGQSLALTGPGSSLAQPFHLAVRVVPKTDGSPVAVVRELQADAAAAKLGKPNVYMLEGYIAARVYSEALRRIPKDPTRVKLRKAIEGLDELSVGGFRVHFTEDRVASKLVELSLIDSQGRVRE